MKDRLKRILLGRWTIALACAAVAYLLIGFLAVPALLGWQIEKQVAQKLGHRVTIGDVRFNPLLFRLEFDAVALADPQARPMLAFDHLLVDFELRSLIDRAWTFSRISLERPVIEFELDAEGGHNFQALVDRLRSPEPQPDGPVPRVIAHQLAVSEARVEYRDRFLGEPTVTRIEPLSIEIDRLTSLPEERGQFRISGGSAQGEAFESSGEVGLSPVAAKGRLSLSGIRVATLARALSRWLDTDVARGRTDVAVDFDVGVASDGTVTARADRLDLAVGDLALSARGASDPSLAVDSIALEGGRADLGAREFSARSLKVRKGSIAAAIDASNRVDWARLVRTTPTERSGERVATPSPASGALAPGAGSVTPATAPWRLSVDAVEVAEIGLTFADEVHGVALQVGQLALGFAPKLEIGSAGLRADLANPRASLEAFATNRAAERASLESASFEGKSITFEQRASPDPAAATTDLRLDGPTLMLSSIGLRPGGDTDRVSVAEGSVDAETVLVSFPQDGLDWSLLGATASLSDALVRGAGDAGENVRLGTLEVAGGVASLRDRSISLERVALNGGAVRAWYDAAGELNLMHLFDDFGGGPPASPPEKDARTGAASAGSAPESAPAEQPWRVAARSVEVDGVSADFEDRRSAPALALGLEAIRMRVGGYDSASSAPVSVEVAAESRDGGTLSANGTVRARDGAADLALKISELALAPARSLLTRYAQLHLVSGAFSAQGRLRYRGMSTAAPQAGGDQAALLDYRGGFSVDRLRLDEADSKQRFLSWDAVSSTELALSVEPNRLEVGELVVDGLDGRLVIGEDRTINVRGVVKPAGPKTPKPEAAREAAAAAAPPEDPFPVSVARVRFQRGSLDFADLSLRPQFATRMHALKGSIVGLSTDPTRVAKLELDARVNDFGSAKIGGQLSLRRPEASTDVTMNFRNLEMTSLSPYVVRFAGYRIEGGTLSLDLEYKVKDGKLLGANKIVVNKIKLGEKVASPGARDLPLELAIALLQDADGVIDIDLPVSGDLKDPQFDIGAVVSKAIGNLIVGIVTAPFRALGALLGAGAEKVDVIAFEPGSDVIPPPDLQKLASVAKVLAQRPGLKLVVAGVQAPELDAPALRSLAVRSAIVRGAGLTLAPGEAPGPIDTADPKIQRAIEAMFSQRHAPEVLQALRSRAGEKGPDSAFYQGLLDRLIADEPLPEASLAQLAARRAEGVVREFTAGQGLPASRVELAEPRKVDAGQGKTVALRLDLAVAK